ncbi:MAG: universal stress protein [Burkholderiales bacterium]
MAGAYKRIFVPVDGSATATAGLREALRLAKDMAARVRLVYVIDEFPVVQSEAFGFTGVDLVRALGKEGEAVLTRSRKQAAGRRVRAEAAVTRSAMGRVGEVIVREAKKWRADLIVMGTHGRRGLSHVVLGSDAETVIRASRVPVLLIRSARRRGQ